MLLVFTSFCLSVNFGPYVTDLTANNFASEVEKRSNTTVYLVMFHGQHCPACQMAYPEFIEAANEASGMIKFGHVDTSSEYALGSRYHIYTIPHFIIFYNGGEKVYNRERSARSFLNAASRYIPNLSETVNESWTELLNNQNSTTESTNNKESKENLQEQANSTDLRAAILFSDKPQTPPIWAGVSCAFANNAKGIRVGFCNDRNVSLKFGINAFPTILLINGQHRYVYNGKNRFQLIRKSIIDFFEGVLEDTPKVAKKSTKPPAPAVLMNNLTSIDTFNTDCKGKGRFCVVQAGGSDIANTIFDEASKKYKHDHFMFFLCPKETCPFDFVYNTPLNENAPKVWIFHHKREAAIVVDNIKVLGSTLDRVIDGGARFIPLDKLKEQESKEL